MTRSDRMEGRREGEQRIRKRRDRWRHVEHLDRKETKFPTDRKRRNIWKVSGTSLPVSRWLLHDPKESK